MSLRSIIRDIWDFIRDLPYRIEHGHSKYDIWDLHYVTSKWLLPRLKSQRVWFAHYETPPGSLAGIPDGFERWMMIQDEIIGAFETIIFIEEAEDEEAFALCCDEDAQKYIDHGLHLFAKYFQTMWT